MNKSSELVKIRKILVRGVSIPSQFFLAPINTGFSKDGLPDSRLVEFHHARSGHRIGISYVGNVAISDRYRVSNATADIDRGEGMWKEVAAIISKNGSIAGIQLACQLDNEPATRKWRNRDQSRYVDRQQRFINSLSSLQLSQIVDGFVSASQHATQLGFEVVQIHAAHGYLLSRLLSPTLNVRRDEFGKDRTLVLSQIIRRIRAASPKTLVDVRISMTTGLHRFEDDWDVTKHVIRTIVESGADIVSISNGMYEVDRFQIYPPQPMGHACYQQHAKMIADEFPSTIVNIAGNIFSLSSLDDAPNNLTYSIGRALIADPEFVAKSSFGQAAEIRECRRTGHCHYFSRGKPHIECGVNHAL
tara:strand:- start:11568 stop:12647 length:1080 start_codon:yes stop_codon:yes gene_type:complete